MSPFSRNLVSLVSLAFFVALAFGSTDGTPSSSGNGSPAGSSTAAASKPETDEGVLQGLNDKIANLDRTPTAYTKDSALLQVARFSLYAKEIASAEVRTNPEIKKKAAELKRRLSQHQSREFPRMRRAWAKEADEKMWENDVDVTVAGNAAQNLTLVGGLFAANRNIKETQKTLSPIIEGLRFKRINFKWIRSADEYTYYTLETPADSEVTPGKER